GSVVCTRGNSGRLALLAFDVSHSKFELEGLACHGMVSCFSVCLLRWNDNFLLLVYLHAGQSFVKPLNHLSSPENYLQRLIVPGRIIESCGFRFFLHRGIEDLPARISSEIMYR